MSSSCSGNCSSCGESCADRKQESLLAVLNEKSRVNKVIAVVSGKGGVGKSTVTSMLAAAMQKLGKRTAILDADITGPSIPKAFGVDECEALSRMVDPMLDEQNFISDQYILIVSSPGLGRQIKRPRDFEFARGKEVEVHTYKAIDGLKEFTGILADFDAGTVTILTGGEEKVFERKAVSSMRLTFEI